MAIVLDWPSAVHILSKANQSYYQSPSYITDNIHQPRYNTKMVGWLVGCV